MLQSIHTIELPPDVVAGLTPADSIWEECDRFLRGIAARRTGLDAEEAHWLLIARNEAVHLKLGYSSFAAYIARSFRIALVSRAASSSLRAPSPSPSPAYATASQ